MPDVDIPGATEAPPAIYGRGVTLVGSGCVLFGEPSVRPHRGTAEPCERRAGGQVELDGGGAVGVAGSDVG